MKLLVLSLMSWVLLFVLGYLIWDLFNGNYNWIALIGMGGTSVMGYIIGKTEGEWR